MPTNYPTTEDPTALPSLSPTTDQPSYTPSNSPTSSNPSTVPTQFPSNTCIQYVCEDDLEARNFCTQEELHYFSTQLQDVTTQNDVQLRELEQLREETEQQKVTVSSLQAQVADLITQMQHMEEILRELN